MLISKFSSAACLVALGASLASLQAEDNPAQAAARRLLMEQGNQPLTAPADSAVSVTPGTPVNFEVGSDGSVHVLQTNPTKPAAETATAPTQPAPTPAVALTPAKPAPQASVDMIPALTLTKAQRLSGLLAKYKADQITPEQYHTLRAKVLSEP